MTPRGGASRMTRIIGGHRRRAPHPDAPRRSDPAHQRPGARGAVLRHRGLVRVAARAALPRPVRRLRRGRARGLVPRGRRGHAGRAGPAHRRADRRATPATLGFPKADVRGAAGVQRPCTSPPAAPYDVVVPRPAVPGRRRRRSTPTSQALVAHDWLVPGALVVVERSGAQPRAGLAGRASTDARQRRYGETVLWYGHAASRPTARAPPTAARSSPCAEPSVPGRSTRSPTGTSTSSARASAALRRGRGRGRASTSPRTGCSRPRSGSTCCARRAPSFANVRVDGFTGLLTDFCEEHDIRAIVKGLRAVSDFDYELQMAQMNASLADVETVFVPDQPGVLLPGLEPGQGGRDVRRRRLRPGAGLRARALLAARLAERPAGGAALSPRPLRFCRAGAPPVTILDDLSVPGPGSDLLSSLDPRAPLVLDTRELGRRPGSQREVTRTVPAPADLGIEVLRVPEGSPVEIDLRLEAVMEGVLVTGTAHSRARGRVRAVPGADRRRDRGDGSRSCSSTTTRSHRARSATTRRTTRPAGSRTTCSTSSPCCGTRWCSHCRSSRCARTTVPDCAPSAVRVWRTTRTTRTRRRSTRGGPALQRAPAGRTQRMTNASRPSPVDVEGENSGCPEAEDVAQQHASPSLAVEGRRALPGDLRQPRLRCQAPAAPRVRRVRPVRRQGRPSSGPLSRDAGPAADQLRRAARRARGSRRWTPSCSSAP